ncbi:hypothetical protein NQ317_007038 [Molorchus minor]|uniref:Striatin N-terminal domain-containing protein n=1 Tax=Molorchus minor TaxID=1323400 RepID=A0ABQ9JG49_9CUCU|nr:hypothetical protein NQ317_007038 [Molorchus minor]
MEDNTLNHQNGGQMGPQSGSVPNNKQNEEVNPKSHYSIPGILHFIQHEWARFELERSQWEVDRAELQARIAFLQGERKGQENLKNDLVRRIKMLEFALKQERAKFHKLKYGTDLQQGDMKPPVIDESGESQLDTDQSYVSVSNSTWKQGRQLLRQYLQEIGYTDRIIDVRRKTTTAGLLMETNPTKGPVKLKPASLAEAMMLDTEGAIIANLEFLSNTDVDMDDDEDMSDDVDIDPSDDIEDDVKIGKQKAPIPKRPMGMNDEENADSTLGLGELAQLTVNNDAENTYDIANSKEAFQKRWNARYTLRSHFDGVRALAFHPTEHVLITASEDHTLKLWNLQKTVPAKKSASLDVEPLYTFRSHTALVTPCGRYNVKLWIRSGTRDNTIKMRDSPAESGTVW